MEELLDIVETAHSTRITRIIRAQAMIRVPARAPWQPCPVERAPQSRGLTWYHGEMDASGGFDLPADTPDDTGDPNSLEDDGTPPFTAPLGRALSQVEAARILEQQFPEVPETEYGFDIPEDLR